MKHTNDELYEMFVEKSADPADIVAWSIDSLAEQIADLQQIDEPDLDPLDVAERIQEHARSLMA